MLETVLDCLHSYSTKDKLKKQENSCKNHDYCYVEMPKEDNKISKYNHGKRSMNLYLKKSTLVIITLKNHQ